MEVHVFSAGASLRQEYCDGGIKSPAIASAISTVQGLGLALNEDGEGLAFVYRTGGTFVVFVNNLQAPSEDDRPKDFRSRFIRASVAYATTSENVARKLFRRMLVTFTSCLDDSEDEFKSSVLQYIRWEKRLEPGYDWNEEGQDRGYVWNAEGMRTLADNLKPLDDTDQFLSSGHDKWSEFKHQALIKELEYARFRSENSGLLCVVSNQRGSTKFQEMNVRRALMLDYAVKTEASTMPGEPPSSGIRMWSSCLLVVGMLCVIGFITMADRSPPVLTRIESNNLERRGNLQFLVFKPGQETSQLRLVFDEPVVQEYEINLPAWANAERSVQKVPSNELSLRVLLSDEIDSNTQSEGLLVFSRVRDQYANEMPSLRIGLVVEAATASDDRGEQP